MQAQPRTLAAAGPRLSTATRSSTGDPARAGALRLAALATLIALASGGVALYATRRLVIDGALARLETVRAAIEADVQSVSHTLTETTAELAGDPRLATFLRDGQRRTTATRGHEEAPPVRPPRWLAVTAQHNGWTDVLLIDDGGERVAYASGEVPLVLADSGLGHVVQRVETLNEVGSVLLVDAGRDPAFGDAPMLYAAASVVDGNVRLGTLVVAIGVAQLEGALRAASGETLSFAAGVSGAAWLVDGSHRVRAALGMQGDTQHGLPPELATSALEGSLQGRESAGAYTTDAGAVLGAYAPLEVGDARWAVAVQVPRSAALAPLRGVALEALATILIAAVLGWFVGARLWTQFAGRLRELSAVLARAQRGDRQARLDVKQDGPVAELATAINRMLEERANALVRAEQDGQRTAREVESLIGAVKEVASGNLAPQPAIADGALGNVARALNEMLAGIGALVGTVREMSSRVGSSAKEIRGCTEQAASTAATQARECGSLTTATQSLRTGNEEISTQCAAAVDAAVRSEQASKAGQTALADLIAGMDGLQRETRAATVKIKRLGERSMQISAITGTISKMSAQTDMLALNAAIEASRAGEHGQGFTVVAEEVRKLAERAAAATKEVERLIAGIQSDVNEAVSGMERQAERLDVQTAAASQAEHALERVQGVTGEASAMLEQISGAASTQLERANEIEAALKRIAEAAKGVQKSSEQARRTSAEIVTVSEELGARATQIQG